VIGIARTSEYFDLNEKPRPFIYLPLYQFYSPSAILHVRTAGNPLASASAVSQAVHELNADLPVFDVGTLETRAKAASFVQRIRMALGAQPTDVLRLVLGQGMRMALLGLGMGLAASLALARFMSSLLFGVSASDPLTFITVVFLLAIVALLAVYIPAHRATRIDPLVALRYE
jgi:putative ABC transport system permease protein